MVSHKAHVFRQTKPSSYNQNESHLVMLYTPHPPAAKILHKNRYNSVKEMDLAIQQKLVIIPPLNNDTFKSKMISLAWIVFTLMIVVDLEPGETIKNSFINKLSRFVFIYFSLFGKKINVHNCAVSEHIQVYMSIYV